MFSGSDIYIIDPLGSNDADDAFSISNENGKDILWIFIADPTKHFKIFDDTFNKIIEKCATKYYYDKPPVNLFDENILSKSNLKNVNSVDCICFKIYIDDIYNSNTPYNYEITFEKIKPNVILNYETAILNSFLEKSIKIANKLQEKRISHIKDVNYIINYPKLVNNKWILEKYNDTCIQLKNMIAEFAIIVNKIIAFELQNDNNIFRSCNTTDELIKCKTDNFINIIIKNGISAKYTPDKNKHYLIDNELYTHFTSPLRRASDCIAHFILKYKINGQNCPFDTEWLKNTSNELTLKTKIEKKRYYRDTKFFTLLAMDNMPKPIKCDFKFISTTTFAGNQFTNLMLTKIQTNDGNEFYTQMSITIKNNHFKHSIKEFVLLINTINTEKKFDNEIFPELKNLLIDYWKDNFHLL